MEQRLQNILAHAGVASRRGAAELIEEGRVKVDGKAVRERGSRIDPSLHEILVDNRSIRKEKKYYFLLNKPGGTVSTAKDTHDRKKITDVFEHIGARLYPVGRLDKDTTGAIIITNDGDLTNRLAHPRYAVDKEYEVVAVPPLKEDAIVKLESGVELEEGRTAPCEIKRTAYGKDSGTYRVKIHEGKKRQIKRVFAKVGSKVVKLKRTKYAGLTLGSLKEGEFRELTESEVERLKAGGEARSKKAEDRG